VVTICTASLTFSNYTFCPHSVFMCFVWISEQTAIISLSNINWLVFITQTQCVYCAVRTASTNISSFQPARDLHSRSQQTQLQFRRHTNYQINSVTVTLFISIHSFRHASLSLSLPKTAVGTASFITTLSPSPSPLRCLSTAAHEGLPSASITPSLG